MRLVGKTHLRRAESSHRAGHRLVGVDDKRFRVEIFDVVRTGRKDAGLPERGLTPGAISAAVENQANLASQDLALFRDARLVIHDQRMSRGGRGELLGAGVNALYRPSGLLR